MAIITNVYPEKWNITNNTNSYISIQIRNSEIPGIEPGGTLNLLRYAQKEDISQSASLRQFINDGRLTLVKDEGEDVVEEILSVEKDELTTLEESTKIKGNSLIVTNENDLQASYDWLSSDDRNSTMGGLSDNNWRTLILSPGAYTLTTTFQLHTDFVSVTGLADSYSSTILKGGIPNLPLLEQTADTITLSNIQTYVTVAQNAPSGFWIRGCDNTNSWYENCDFGAFTNIGPLAVNCGAVEQTNFKGTWVNCTGGDFCFRATGEVERTITVTTPMTVQPSVGDILTQAVTGATLEVESSTSNTITGKGSDLYDWDTTNTFTSNASMEPSPNIPTNVTGSPVIFDPVMVNCHTYSLASAERVLGTGTFCFIGDGVGPLGDTLAVPGRSGVIGKGKYYNCTSGWASFSGCTNFSAPIHEDALFVNCYSGHHSFGMATTVAGTFIGCKASGSSFGASLGGTDQDLVNFSGYAENCEIKWVDIFKGNGFGSGDEAKCTGTLVNCRAESLDEPIRLEGASIEGCYFKQIANSADCIQLIDNDSNIYDSILFAHLTGYSIASADGNTKLVVTAHNRMNRGFDTTPLVTSITGTAYDVISSNLI